MTGQQQPPQAPTADLRKPYLLLTIAAFLVAEAVASPRIAHAEPDGAPVFMEPFQDEVSDATPWQQGEYEIAPLAEYEVNARVLSTAVYDDDREAQVAPIDFALGWGGMADRELLEQLSVHQDNRWYYVRWRNLALDPQDVIANSSNHHLLPANDEVLEQLKQVEPGDSVRLKGKLVRITADDGWSWTSSTSRFDTGDGACEVMWVESVEIFPDEPIQYAQID